MSKYDPLGQYLESRSDRHIAMSFAEIERIVGSRLPRSKMHRAWWSNNPSNNVMTRQWLSAGYQTEQVDIAGERLVFTRAGPRSGVPNGRAPSARPSDSGQTGGGPARDRLFGSMKGSLSVAEGVDLTRPAEPEWGRCYDDG